MHESNLKKLMLDVTARLQSEDITILPKNRELAYKSLDQCVQPTLCRLGFECLIAQITGDGLPLVQIPYHGSITSTVHISADLQFTVRYTKLTLDEYLSQKPQNTYKIMTWDQVDKLNQQWEETLYTTPKHIPRQRFIEALEIMPPRRHRFINGVEFFHMAENLHGTVTTWYAATEYNYFTFINDMALTEQTLATIAKQCKNLAQVAKLRQQIGK